MHYAAILLYSSTTTMLYLLVWVYVVTQVANKPFFAVVSTLRL
jgi:hypothetical protein